jgi:hypothetical protein
MEVKAICGCKEGGEIELLSLHVLKVKATQGSSGRVGLVPKAAVSKGDFWTQPPDFFLFLKPHLKSETRLPSVPLSHGTFSRANASQVMISFKQQSLYAELPR